MWHASRCFRQGVVSLVLGLMAVSFGSAVGSATEGAYAIKATRIYTASASSQAPAVIHDGVLLIEDGKVSAVGSNVEIPDGIPVRDLGTAVIIPGLIGAISSPNSRVNIPESVGAQYRAVDSHNPYSSHRDALGGGVTTLHLSPGRNRLVTGQGAVVKLGTNGGGFVLSASSDLCINLSDAALNPPSLIDIPFPSSWDQEIKRAERQMPESRMGMLLELDRMMQLAASKENWLEDEDGVLAPSLSALRRVLDQRSTYRIEAQEARDLVAAVRWFEENGRRGYLALADEAHKVASVLASSGIPVVLQVDGAFSRTSKSVGHDPDPLDTTPNAAALLHEKGVRFALAQNQDESPRQLLLAAGLAVGGGLDPSVALAAITRVPAEILGVSDRVGSLEPGKDADFVVLTGDPFAATTSVYQVYTSGDLSFAGRTHAMVVKADHVLTGDGTDIRSGAVLIEDGKIAAVGTSVPTPPGARVVDGGPGSYISPGFIDAHGHLGLAGDRATPGTDVPIWRTVAVPRNDFARVASSGVTSVMLSPVGANSKGSQMAAIKTWGSNRDDLIARKLVAIKFLVKERDPLFGTGALDAALRSGKAYYDKWEKFKKDLAKWEEEEKKKKADEANKKDVKKAPEVKKETVEVDTKTVSDIVSGKWETVVSGGPIPQPQTGNMYLKLEGSLVSGKFQMPFGEEAELAGTLDGNKLTLEVDAETPFGAPTVTAEIDKEDHMIGSISVGPISLNLEATRTEKEVGEIKITRKKKKKDGRPAAPTVQEALEPHRDLFSGKIVAFVGVNLLPEIDAVVELFARYKLPVVLQNVSEAEKAVETLKKAGVGVVVSPFSYSYTHVKDPRVKGDVLTRGGIPVAFQSNVGDGVRSLRMNAILAVKNGMDATEALKALTIYPAKMFKIEDRIGSVAVGRDADLVLFSGHPLEPTSRVLHVLVSGQEVTKR